jgi:hypothetical protein
VFILKDFLHTNLAMHDRRRPYCGTMKPSQKPQVPARTTREPRPELQEPIAGPKLPGKMPGGADDIRDVSIQVSINSYFTYQIFEQGLFE